MRCRVVLTFARGPASLVQKLPIRHAARRVAEPLPNSVIVRLRGDLAVIRKPCREGGGETFFDATQESVKRVARLMVSGDFAAVLGAPSRVPHIGSANSVSHRRRVRSQYYSCVTVRCVRSVARTILRQECIRHETTCSSGSFHLSRCIHRDKLQSLPRPFQTGWIPASSG